jgi:TrmH family RNA methyltransferase
VSTITSRRHPIALRFREAARGRLPLALLDGWHLQHEAAGAGMTFDVVAVGAAPDREEDVRLLARLEAMGVSVVRVSSSVLSALTPVRTPTGIVSLVRRRQGGIAGVLSGARPLVVVAVDLQDPGNTGAMIRSAEAGGATGAICAGATADPWGWKAVRAAMGSAFRLPLHEDPDAARVCRDLRDNGIRIVATATRDGTPMHELDLRGPTALVLGSEGRGLDAEILQAADALITIPMQAPVESLNVAVAAGVLIYEARRQRSQLRQ